MALHPVNRLRAVWLALPVRYRGAVVVAIPAICLAITLSAWVWSRDSLLSIRRKIDHTDEVIRQSNQVLSDLVNVETGVRGYAFTRNPDFLAPYNQSSQRYKSGLDRLENLLKRDSTQLNNLQKLKGEVQTSISISKQIVDATDDVSLEPKKNDTIKPFVYAGKEAMDRVRQSIDQMQTVQKQAKDKLLKQRENVQEATLIAIWIAAIVSAVGLGSAVFLFRQLDMDLRDRDTKLRESKSLLQALVFNMVDGVINLDEHGNIELFNPTACEMFGYTPDEVIGKRLDLLLKDSNLLYAAGERGWELTQAYPQQRGRAWQTSGLRKDGTLFPIAISISDVQLGDRRLLAIIRDMTEFQQIQAKLQTRADELVRISAILAQTNNALEDRNRELEQFAYVASHDLKAPLRAIANLSEWLEEDLNAHLQEENQHQMRLLRGRVLRMEALINGLLDYSRVGRTQTQIEPVVVRELLADILDSLDPPATFVIDIAPDMPTFNTKALLLQQVFANLIGNAIKHHDRPEGRIQIAVKDEGDRYQFTVADDGPGIAPEYHAKIFVIFQTLEARDTKESTGVGLSIVKKIVESEGGTIEVDSHPGKGTAFHFTWLKKPIQ